MWMGGLRDGYPLNIAVRLGRAERIIGVNLGYAGMRRDTVLAEGPVEILSQALDIMMRAQYEDRLEDRALSSSKIMTINPLIYDIGTFEVEYIPDMIQRGYTVAAKLFAEWGPYKGQRGQCAIFLWQIPRFSGLPPRQGHTVFSRTVSKPNQAARAGSEIGCPGGAIVAQ